MAIVKDINKLVDKPMTEMTEFDFQLQRYLLYLAVEKGLAHSTVISYSADLIKFQKYLEVRQIDDARGVDRKIFHSYITELHSQGKTARTVARKVSALKGIFRFLKMEGDVVKNPTLNFESPKLPQRIPRILSMEQVDQLINMTDKSKTSGLRDRAMFELMYATGFRVSELVNIPLDNVNLNAGYARVIGKGNRERISPIGKKAISAVDDYIENAREQLLKGKKLTQLFASNHGKGLTRQGFWFILKSYTVKMNLGFEVKPHTIRHSVATHMLENGADLSIVQEVLGHKNIATTEIYTHLSNEHLRKTYENFHPRSHEE